ncbi:MAG: hypothetical protein QGI06_14710 [Rhodospirillales bacterium]|jgi:hypothetical protein|nr:hypothetical protein [Rhodospirillales bacterium]|tara:strand:- start:80 stop:256 length:177 start_codon:yes stop_codon:yes gene_type:complete
MGASIEEQAMSMAIGQLLAYLKVAVLAFALMAVVWGIVKFIETRGRAEIGDGDEAETD